MQTTCPDDVRKPLLIVHIFGCGEADILTDTSTLDPRGLRHCTSARSESSIDAVYQSPNSAPYARLPLNRTTPPCVFLVSPIKPVRSVVLPAPTLPTMQTRLPFTSAHTPHRRQTSRSMLLTSRHRKQDGLKSERIFHRLFGFLLFIDLACAV